MATDAGVFISYAADTKPLAEELATALQREGIQSWADFKDLRPGQRWQDEIEHALEAANAVVMLVSLQSHATPRIEAEWRTALVKVWSDPHKAMIPVVVGSADPPPFLRDWVPLRIDPGAEPANWTRRVIDAMKSRRNELVRAQRPQDRRERQERLDEIGRTARELGTREAAWTESHESAK